MIVECVVYEQFYVVYCQVIVGMLVWFLCVQIVQCFVIVVGICFDV